MKTRSATAEKMPLKDAIRAEATALGFEAVGFARAADVPEGGAALAAFTGAQYHGDMAWMAERADRRAHPAALWPETKTVISLAMNYGHGAPTGLRRTAPGRGEIAAYALGRDYHLVMKSRLKRLARTIHEAWGGDVKVFVDTAPVMEKPIAAAAGIGWQGKHTNLVSREFGSWLFLGEIFTTLEIAPDAPATDHCGTCRACLDACPTGAFPAPGRLDARRCISYLTIEHAGHIDREFRAPMGNRIYGCDDCLAACPWNKYARKAREHAFLPRVELTAPRLADLARLDDAAFRQVFSTSPVKRLGRDRFVRNVLIAIGNSGDPALAPEAERLLGDGSALVRAMAVWALSRLLDADAFAALSRRLRPAETDAQVLAEWDHAGAARLTASGAAAQ